VCGGAALATAAARHLCRQLKEGSMDYESIPFGIKMSVFVSAILILTYAVAAIAPQSDEDAGVKIEYAALSY
jgi:hypothetical protein